MELNPHGIATRPTTSRTLVQISNLQGINVGIVLLNVGMLVKFDLPPYLSII
jgi:hypothetical protein